MSNTIKNITIVGGGTAGWVSALYINKFFPEVSISLITDSSIGILGAGEGTTYNFTKLLNTLDIDETDFILKTKATKKIGINLKNWRGDGKDFNHSTVIPDSSWYFFHFDARLLADYFKNIGITRGIKYIDSNVSGFIQNEKDIIGIKYGDNILNCDFVIDCSGFSRIIIGKLYNTEWISYKHELRLNKAFAYFLPQTKKIKEDDRFYTTSIAMDAGWMWQVPLQHRWGCGYAYDDEFITFEDAKCEVEKYLNQKIEIVKEFKFEPGSYKELWVNNVVAVGLSSSFLEPLEATSMYSSIVTLQELCKSNFDKTHKNKFNKIMQSVNEQCMLFIRHHYITDRNDTPFWQNYQSMGLPTKLKNMYSSSGEFSVKNNKVLSNILECENIIKPIFNPYNYSMIHKNKHLKFKNNLI